MGLFRKKSRTSSSDFRFDSFSSGQIGSKLWLCQQLEEIINEETQVIWVLGGWYALTPFLLVSREKLTIEAIHSFDLDLTAWSYSLKINDFGIWQKKFYSWAYDVNKLDYSTPEDWSSPAPSLVINTSCEHFTTDQWFQNIPSGTRVALQANDMPHADHVYQIQDESEMLGKFPLSQTEYLGTLPFRYGNSSDFNRFMLIGRK